MSLVRFRFWALTTVITRFSSSCGFFIFVGFSLTVTNNPRGGNPSDYLFCNEYGEQATERTYQQLVRRYNIKRNVNKTSCHLFRHTFAKQWILAGGDIFRLQKILGHSDLTVTKEYVNMFGQDLQLDFERFNPLDNMKGRKAVIRMA